MAQYKGHSLLTTTPRWTLELLFRALHPQFELKNEVQKRQRLTCDRIEKLGAIYAPLATRMRRCRHQWRCSSGACEICMRVVRMRLIYQASLLFQKLLEVAKPLKGEKLPKATLKKMWVVSAVDHTLVVAREYLDAATVVKRMETIQRRLKRSALRLATIFGGLDVSLNFGLDPSIPPVWWPHFYIVICTDLAKEHIEAVFKDIFLPGEGADDPVHVKFTKKSAIPTIVSYAVKARFTRRIPYVDSKGIRRTRKPWLRADQATELAIFLDQVGIGNRLLLGNLKIIKGTLTQIKMSAAKSGSAS